jgi:hypothetical protein
MICELGIAQIDFANQGGSKSYRKLVQSLEVVSFYPLAL